MMFRTLLSAVLALVVLAGAVPALAANPERFPPALMAAFDEAKASMMGDPAETLRHVEQAEAMASRLSDPRQRRLALATAAWLSAEAHLRRNETEAAKPLLERAIRLIEPLGGDIKLRGNLLLSRGALFMQEDQAAEALGDFQNAYRVFQRVGDRRGQAMALQNIGVLYSAANDEARAERYYRQANEVYDGDPALSLSLHNRRGNVLLVLERYAEAEAEYRQALNIARQLDSPMLEARVLGNLARTQVEAGELDAAEQTLARGFALARGPGAQGFRQQLLATASRVALDRGDLPRARSLITQAFDGVDLMRTTLAFREAHLFAYMIYARLGDSAHALAHLEALQRLTTEASKVATTTSAALMAARFDYANQELRIANLKAEELRRNVAYERSRARLERMIFLAIAGATAVVIALLSFGVVVLRRSRNEVRAANADLAETNRQLEKALAAKTEFLATTSHEIRTPLNGILGMTQVMLADPRMEPAMRDRINLVHGAGLTMRALVDDILDVAKMETGNLTVEPVPMDLRATLNDVARMWEEQAKAKGIAFHLDIARAPHWIVSDAGRLRQVVFNLLSNALKFTLEGSVTLRAWSTEPDAEGDSPRLCLSVSDTGIGIPADKLETIFESFKQADTSTTRRFGGTGLGLAICRNLAHALGGGITVESVPDKGSTFTVELPLELAENQGAPENADEEEGRGLLIVDRNPIARSMMRTLLEPHFPDTRFAADAEEARAAMEGKGVEVVLVDEAALGKDADRDARARALAGDVAAHHARGLLLCSAENAAALKEILAGSAFQILVKPVKGDALVDAIVAMASRKGDRGNASKLVSNAA